MAGQSGLLCLPCRGGKRNPVFVCEPGSSCFMSGNQSYFEPPGSDTVVHAWRDAHNERSSVIWCQYGVDIVSFPSFVCLFQLCYDGREDNDTDGKETAGIFFIVFYDSTFCPKGRERFSGNVGTARKSSGSMAGTYRYFTGGRIGTQFVYERTWLWQRGAYFLLSEKAGSNRWCCVGRYVDRIGCFMPYILV